MNEKKPIDQIHEPIRQELLNTFQSIERSKTRIRDIKKRIEDEPDRMLTSSDLKSVCSEFELQYEYVSTLLYQITDIHAKYFQGMDAKK